MVGGEPRDLPMMHDGNLDSAVPRVEGVPIAIKLLGEDCVARLLGSLGKFRCVVDPAILLF